MSSLLSPQFSDTENLFRGVIDNNWDYEENRPSSATFKDSQGASVDRDGGRTDEVCTSALLSKRPYKAVVKLSVADVKSVGAILIYKPEDDNIFHSEIHDSTERAQLRGSKPTRLREKSTVIYVS
jgi:hypothetical protein